MLLRSAFLLHRRSVIIDSARRLPVIQCNSYTSNMSNNTTTGSQVILRPSLTTIDIDAYDAQLAAKQKKIETLFSDLNLPNLEIFKSEPHYYRMK